MLKEMAASGQRKGQSGTGSNQHKQKFSDGTSAPTMLADLGVTKKQSHNWQKLANMPGSCSPLRCLGQGMLDKPPDGLCARRPIRLFQTPTVNGPQEFI